MNKKILLTFLFVLITVILSVSAISASDVNVTDSYTSSVMDDASDISVSSEDVNDSSVLSVSSESNVDNGSSYVSVSENSNTLSTNSDSNSLSNASEVNNTTVEPQPRGIQNHYFKRCY